MVTKTTTKKLCDICGKKAVKSLSIPIGSHLDAAGSDEIVWYDIDLCGIHLKEISHMAGFEDEVRFCKLFGARYRKTEEYPTTYERRELSRRIEMLKDIWRDMSVEDKALAKKILML